MCDEEDAVPDRDEEAQDLYHLLGNSPSAWRRHGNGMVAAVRVLLDAFHEATGARDPSQRLQTQYDPHHTQLTVQMLSAMAIECLLKGIIAKSKPIVENGRLVSRGGHNLITLAKEAGIDLSPRESLLLKRYTLNNSWPTRYPVPQKESQMSAPIAQLAQFGFGDDEEVTAQLMKRLNNELDDV